MRILITLAVLFTLLFSSCTEDNILPDNGNNNQSISSSMAMSLPDSVTLTFDNAYEDRYHKLHLSLKNLDDSRCPDGADCVWEGYATVDIELTLDKKKQIVTLHSIENPDKNTPLSKSRTTSGYYFELLNVTPYPDVEKDIVEKQAKVKVFVRKL